MRRPFTVTFAAAMAFVGATVVPNQWVQHHLALRFGFVLALGALGLPFALPLLQRRPVPVGTSRGTTTGMGDVETAGADGEVEAPERRAMVRWAALAGAGFVGWALLSALLSGRAALSVFGLYEWATGAIFVAALVGAWALGFSAGRPAKEDVERALLIAVALNAALAIIQARVDLASVELGTFSGRPTGLWSNPVYLGGFLVGGYWLVAHRCSRSPARWGALVVLVAGALQVSGSRFAVGLLLAAVLAGYWAFGLRPAAILGVLVLVGLLFGAAVAGGSHSTSTSRVTNDASSGFRPRLETWREAPQEIAERPLLGAGPGQFQRAAGPHRSLAMARSEGPNQVFADAHNLIVEYAVTTGLPGLLLMLGFLGSSLLLAGWRSPLAGFGTLVLAMHLVQPLHASLTPLATLALGVAAAGPESVRPALPRRARIVLGVVAGLAACMIAVGTVRLSKISSDVQTAEDNARVARTLLPIWSLPYSNSARIASAANALAQRGANSLVPLGAQTPTATPAQIRAWWVDATKREPDSFVWWIDLADFDAGNGDKTSAETEYRRALHANPWALAALNHYASMLETEGRSSEARGLLIRSLQAQPQQPQVADELAHLGGLPPLSTNP